MAYEIWMAHREIETGEKLLADIQETMARDQAETPVDRSCRRGFQLGVPSVAGGNRILDLDPALAQKIIEQNIDLQRTRLIELSDKVRDELADPAPGNV